METATNEARKLWTAYKEGILTYTNSKGKAMLVSDMPLPHMQNKILQLEKKEEADKVDSMWIAIFKEEIKTRESQVIEEEED